MSQLHNSTPVLVDPFGRRVEYLRLSVTGKCNLHCFSFLREGFRGFEEPDNWLRFDELERFVAALAELGVNRIRLTGGEPLVHKNLPRLASRLVVLPGMEDLSLSTNATLLQRQRQLPQPANGQAVAGAEFRADARRHAWRLTGALCAG
jgi:cyclic pyranopterin phosphate synthase